MKLNASLWKLKNDYKNCKRAFNENTLREEEIFAVFYVMNEKKLIIIWIDRFLSEIVMHLQKNKKSSSKIVKRKIVLWMNSYEPQLLFSFFSPRSLSSVNVCAIIIVPCAKHDWIVVPIITFAIPSSFSYLEFENKSWVNMNILKQIV